MESSSGSRMAVLLPSRVKPEELLRVALQIADTAVNPIDLFAYVDEQDPKRAEYDKLAGIINIEFGPRLYFCDAINHLAARTFPHHDLLFVGSDDFHFVGKGWDKEYRDVVPADGLGMIFCDAAPFDGRDLPFTACVTRTWYDALGYVLLPALHHMYGDNAMQDLAQFTKCEVRIPSRDLIEHHWNMQDPRRVVPGYYPSERDDFAAYMDWQGSDRFMKDAIKLRRARCHSES